MEGLNKAELGVRLAEIRKIKNEKAATVKKLEAELKGLQRAHEVQSTAHDEQTRQLDETMYKLTMVNEEYEALQTAQRRIRQQGEIPETEDVRKLCVAIARQYLSEVKTEDELRERMDRTGGLGDASGLFSEDVDLDVDGKMVHIDGFDDGVDSEDEDEAAGQAAVALLEAEMKERKKMETALEHAEHLADGTDPTGMAMMIDEKMDDTDLQGALGLFAGAGDDPNDLDAQGDYEEKTHAALGGGGSGGSSGGGGGGGAGGGGTGGSMDGGGSGGTGGGDDDPGSKFQKEQHDKAIQLHREMKEAEVWLERRQRLSVRKERNLESKLDGQKRIKVKYSTDGNVFFEVMLLVNQGDTFQNVLEEACAHWGLPSDSAFLQDWEDEAIWPASSVIEESVDIQLVTPCVRLVFRLGYNVQQLVASAGGDLDPDLQQAKAQILDMTDDVEKIEKELIADGQVNKEGAGAKRYIERKSKMTRDLMLFMVFFILLNVTLGMRRAVSDLFYLTSTLREATVERPFFVPILRETPIITSNASLWEDGGGLAPAPAPPTAMAGGGAGAPNAPGLSRGGLTLLGYENKTEMARTTFRDIRNDAQLWYWLEHVLMDAVFPPQSAGNTSSLVLKDNVVAGHSVRLRQLRSRVNTSCEVSKVGDADKWVDFCYSGWSKSTEDQMAYIPAWIFGWTGADDAQGVNAPGHSEVDSILNEAFTYHRDKDLAELSAGGTTDITGRFDNYGQGGYKYDLKVDLRRPDARAAFKRDLELLKRGSWTGRGTRAMTVDLALYNQNLNMFVTATYVFELTLGGGYGTSFHMATVRLESDLFTIDNMAISVCEILLHLFVLYFLWCQLLDMYHAIKFRGGCGAYLGNFWKLVDLLMIGLYFSSVGFRVMQYLTFAPYADRLRVENVFDFTLLSYPAWVYESALQADACVIFVSVIRLLQYAVLNENLEQFLLTFKRAAVEIAFYAGIFLLAFFGFVMVGYEVFGPAMREFATLGDTTTTLLQLMGGSPSLHQLYEGMRRVDPDWAPAFFFMYICFTVLILVNIFLAILNATYTQVDRDMTIEHQRLKILESLRPSKKKTVKDVVNFFKNEVFNAKKAFSAHGIYGDYDKKRHKLKEVLELAAKSSNPWARQDGGDDEETKAQSTSDRLRPGEKRQQEEERRRKKKAADAAAAANAFA